MKHIPLIKPQIDARRLKSAVDKIAQTGILTKGPYLAVFEKKIANYLGVKYAFATSSCTTALHLGLVACGIKPGDEVLVSDFTFPATGNVVVQVGAMPVFVDIDIGTYCLSIDDLKSKITKKTRAIMVVHPFGYPANMSEITKIARANRLLVIEDAACALGSKHREKYLGVWGDVGCFSFHPRKNITTGEGGAIVTNNIKIAQKIEILRNHGGVKGKIGWKFIENGFNYRLSELQAALGVIQLTKLEPIIRQRQKIAYKYIQRLQRISQIVPLHDPKDGVFNFQSFIIRLPQNIIRDNLIKYLASKGIETTLGTYALHAEKAFAKFGYKPGDLPNSYRAYQSALTLPLYGQMTEKEIAYVVENVAQALACKKHAKA